MTPIPAAQPRESSQHRGKPQVSKQFRENRGRASNSAAKPRKSNAVSAGADNTA